MKRIVKLLLLAGVGVLLVIQLVPYGRNHSNPPVTKEPAWDSPKTRQLAADACFDCHSNEVRWRWYSNIAPASWLVQKDVDEGRGTLNFSEWDRPQEGKGDVVETIQSGGMPPWQYKLLWSGARLSAAEKQQLIAGLRASGAG